MSTIKNIDTIGIAGIMNNPLDSVTRTSALKDIVKPFDDSLIDSVARIGSVKYNNDEVNHSPCYTVTYSLHSVNSVKLYIYFSSSTWSLLCACFFMIILPLPSLPFLYYLCRLYFLTICAIIISEGGDYIWTNYSM